MCVITRQRPRPRASFRLPSAPATVIASIKAEAAVMGYAHDVDSPRAHSCALVMIHALAIFYGRAKHSSKDEGGPSLQQSRKLKRLDTVASCCGRSALRHPGFAATVALVGFTYGPHIMVSSRSSHSGGTQRRLVSKKAPLGGLPYVLPQPRLQKSASGVRSQTAPLISNDTHKQKQVSQLHSQYQNIGSPPAHVSMPRCVQKITQSTTVFRDVGHLECLILCRRECSHVAPRGDRGEIERRLEIFEESVRRQAGRRRGLGLAERAAARRQAQWRVHEEDLADRHRALVCRVEHGHLPHRPRRILHGHVEPEIVRCPCGKKKKKKRESIRCFDVFRHARRNEKEDS